MKNEKTFTTIAKTSKGSFKVAVKVYQETLKVGNYSNLVWNKKAFVFVDKKWMPIRSFNETSFNSAEMMQFFVVKNLAIRVNVDLSNVFKHMNGIDKARRKNDNKERQRSVFIKQIHDL